MKSKGNARFHVMRLAVGLMVLSIILSACAAPAATQAPAVEAPAATEAAPAETEEAPAATEAPAPPAEPVEVTFWAALGGNNGTILEEAVKTFNASQNEVVVKYEFQGAYGDAETKFLTALAGGAVPDLVMLEISRIPGFARSGSLLALDDLAAGPNGVDLSDFSEGLLKESRIDGMLYSLPQARSMPVFYYNKDMFKAAGLDPEKAPADWAALRDAAIKMTKSDGSQIGFGLQIGNPWWYFQMATENYGAQVSTGEGDACVPAFNDPKAVEAYQWWYDLVYKDKAARIYPGQGLTTWEALQADFISGKVGMMFITTGWMGNIEKNSPFDVGVAMIPAGPSGERHIPTGGNGIVIPVASPVEKQEASWKFLKWLTDTPQTAKWSQDTGYMPLRLSAMEDPGLQKYFTERPNFKVAVSQMEYASPFPCIKLNPKTESTLDKLWERIFVGKEDIKKVADDVAQQVKDLPK
jgi:sn-glycerol 3-phosphate transport system substrate-binding protein